MQLVLLKLSILLKRGCYFCEQGYMFDSCSTLSKTYRRASSMEGGREVMTVNSSTLHRRREVCLLSTLSVSMECFSIMTVAITVMFLLVRLAHSWRGAGHKLHFLNKTTNSPHQKKTHKTNKKLKGINGQTTLVPTNRNPFKEAFYLKEYKALDYIITF